MNNAAKAYLRMLSEEHTIVPAGVTSSIKRQSSVDLSDTPNNVALHALKKIVPDYDFNQSHPASSIVHQYAIGRANELAASASPEYKKRVFAAYKQQSPHSIGDSHDYDSLVNHTYSSLAKHTHEQFNSLPVAVTFHPGDIEYPSSKHMVDDVHKNRHLAVFTGGDPHTHLGKVDGAPETANNMFRAAHDFYGHAVHGNQFGPKGEEIAWSTHRQMFPVDAHAALTAETRGQNSQVNYTTLNLDNLTKMKSHREAANSAKDPYAKAAHSAEVKKLGQKFNYAKQVASVLPPEMNSPQYNGVVPESIKPLLRDKGADVNPDYDLNKDHLQLHALAKLHAPDDHVNVARKLAAVHGYTGVSALNEAKSQVPVHDLLLDSDYALIRRKK